MLEYSWTEKDGYRYKLLIPRQEISLVAADGGAITIFTKCKNYPRINIPSKIKVGGKVVVHSISETNAEYKVIEKPLLEDIYAPLTHYISGQFKSLGIFVSLKDDKA